MQPVVPIPSHIRRNDVTEWQAFFKVDKFDIRKRSYEAEDAHHQRIMLAAIAHQTNYRTEDWMPLEAVVDLCPRGSSNRLNLGMPQFAQCYYLEMKHVTIEDWSVPEEIPLRETKGLSRRAGYLPRSGDVLLSRFKEPLGKCLLYHGDPRPLVANTNFLLLRSKSIVSPFFVLGVLKSSFLAMQLHRIIQRKALRESAHAEYPKAC